MKETEEQLKEFGREPWEFTGRKYKGIQVAGEDVQHWRH